LLHNVGTGDGIVQSMTEHYGKKIFPGDAVHLFAVMLGHGLNDAVTGSDIVEKEVAVRMKLLFAERVRDGVGATIDLCAGGSGGQSLYVAGLAADGSEQFGAMASLGSLRQLGIASRSFAGAHEAREMVDVGKAVGARLVIGFADGIANTGDFVWLEAAGAAQLVEIGVGADGDKTGVMVLHADTTNGGMAG